MINTEETNSSNQHKGDTFQKILAMTNQKNMKKIKRTSSPDYQPSNAALFSLMLRMRETDKMNKTEKKSINTVKG